MSKPNIAGYSGKKACRSTSRRLERSCLPSALSAQVRSFILILNHQACFTAQSDLGLDSACSRKIAAFVRELRFSNHPTGGGCNNRESLNDSRCDRDPP